MPKVKVLNVISDSNIGGAGRMLLTFLKKYDRESFDAAAVLPPGSKLRTDAEALGIPVIEAGGLAETSISRESIKSLTGIVNAQNPHIVHTHASMSARIAARRAGAKVVYTRHSVFPNKRLLTSFPGKQVFGALNNYYADRIIAVSPAAMHNITETGVDPHKVTVIYNGVESEGILPAAEKPAVRKVYGLSAEDFICGIFARITPVKGHDYILDAAKLLMDKPQIKIAVAGTGEYEGHIAERIAREGIKNVSLLGFVKDSARLISAMDVQLNASYGTEATSLALLEGMGAGVPAVASDFGGNPYVIADGENGFIVPQKNGQAIAQAILRIYTEKTLREKLSRKSLEIFNGRFTADMMTRQIEQVYMELYESASKPV